MISINRKALAKNLPVIFAATLLQATYGKDLPGIDVQQDSYFYTGKPYDVDLGDYTFAYRNYNPHLNRWTTADPSGFPDGANNQYYAPVPTNDFDFQGLLKWSTLRNTGGFQPWTDNGHTLSSEIYTVETEDGGAIIVLWKNTVGGGMGTNYTYNCHGYAFANSEYWIPGQIDAILKGDGYQKIEGSDKTGAKLAYWGSDLHTAKVTEVDSNGVVTKVQAKRGHATGLSTTSPEGQGYPGSIIYYE